MDGRGWKLASCNTGVWTGVDGRVAKVEVRYGGGGVDGGWRKLERCDTGAWTGAIRRARTAVGGR